MIIKIMESKGGDFWMCDNVENVFVDTMAETNNEGPIYKRIGSGSAKVVCSIFADPEGPDKRITTAINFKKMGEDERYVAFFNTMAYICNDNGQTVERIFG